MKSGWFFFAYFSLPFVLGDRGVLTWSRWFSGGGWWVEKGEGEDGGISTECSLALARFHITYNTRYCKGVFKLVVHRLRNFF